MKTKECLKKLGDDMEVMKDLVMELAKLTITSQKLLVGNVSDNVGNLSAAEYLEWAQNIALADDESEITDSTAQKEKQDIIAEKMHDVKKEIKSVSKDVDAVDKYIHKLNNKFKSQESEMDMLVETLIYSLYLQGTVPMSFDNSLKKIHGKVKKKAEKKMETLSVLDISK